MNPWLSHLLRAAGRGSTLPSSGQTFYASLKTSLVPEVGTGGPTWARATEAWRFNELGYLQKIPSGCAEFGGARLVRNLCIAKSEVFNGSEWTKAAVTTPSANLVVCSNATVPQRINESGEASSSIIGASYKFTFRVSYVDIRYVQITGSSSSFGSAQYCNFDIVSGTATAVGCVGSIVNVSPGVYDISIIVTATLSATGVTGLLCLVDSMAATRVASFVGDGVKSIGVMRYHAVDVTGRDASYVPEYVSVGVVSTPFFGAGIDGAKYFETDWQGAPIPAANLLGFRREAAATNNLLWSRDMQATNWIVSITSGSEIITNGDFAIDASWAKETGWTIGTGVATKTAGVAGRVYQSTTLVIGKTYTVSYELTRTAGTMTVSAVSSNTQFCLPRTTSGTYTETFTANSVITSLAFGGDAAFAGTVDNVSVKESAIQISKTTGLDGIANTATTLTAAAANATILQTTSGIASAARCASAYVKRRTGSGTISFTQDGGSTWTDITSLINSSTWTRVQITSTLANPSVGFKIGTSGDAIDVDCVQNEAGTVATSPIVTTTTTISRNADVLTYQTAGNIDATVGSCYVMYSAYEEISTSHRAIIGLSTTAVTANALLYNSSYVATTSLYSGDGTTSISKSGLLSAVNTPRKRAISWGGSTRLMTGDGVSSTSGAFSGTLPSTAIGICGYTNGTLPISGRIRDVAIYNYTMTDAELQGITT